MIGFVKEYWEFIRARKAYWMIPLLVMLGLIGALIVYTNGSVVAPFVYTLF